MVSDITLRRCTVRVVRRGGWSWGREPRQLVNDVVRALPALLAAELQRHLPEDAEGEINAPLRVEVKTSLSELREWGRATAAQSDSSPGAGYPAAPGGQPPGQHAIVEALQRALGSVHLAERLTIPKPAVAPSDAKPREPEPHERASVLLNVLKAWRSAGALETFLRGLPDPLVLAWHRVLFEPRVTADMPKADTATMRDAPSLAAIVQRAIDASSLEPMRLRLLAAGELAVQLPANASPRAVGAAVEAVVALEAADSLAPSVATKGPRVFADVRAPPGFETRVASALPFLLLGPLHRIGWLDVLYATLSGAKLAHNLPTLAIALASKILPEPERGWRRLPAAVHAAATFAGDTQVRPDSELVELARTSVPMMPALDAVIRRSLLDGRSHGDTLLACAAGDVRLVVDPPGVFLLAHAQRAEDLAAPLLEGRALVFIPEEDADTQTLAELDRAGVTFVTSARPVRDERWTAIPGTRAPRLYSNRQVQRIVPPAASVAERARETWRAFEKRPLPGRPPDPALDRSLSLAASLALGTIAWELWRSRESTDPLLALERFGDLDGSVRFEPHRVRVRLPMGKRFRDLKEAGLLEDIPRVPWLDFRTLVFAGG
jgi:hypothetical protein